MPYPYNELWGLPPVFSGLSQQPQNIAAKPSAPTPASRPLSEGERLRRALMLARSQGNNPSLMAGIDRPVIDPQAYGIQSIPEEETALFAPGEEDAILRSGFNEGANERLDRQYAQGQEMLNSQLPELPSIRMSSGTSFTPASSTEAVLANILRQAAGAYGMRRAEEKRKKLDRKEKEAARKWAKRVMEGPKTTGDLAVQAQNERDLGRIPAPQVDLGEETLWDRLRRKML